MEPLVFRKTVGEEGQTRTMVISKGQECSNETTVIELCLTEQKLSSCSCLGKHHVNKEEDL